MRYLIFILLLFFLSCDAKQEKKQPTINDTARKIVDTIPAVKADTLATESFNITKLIPAFLKDNAFHHVSGIQVGWDYQQTVIYNVYVLPRKNIFNILHPKVWKLSQDPKQQQLRPKLIKIDSKAFFATVYKDYENNRVANNFYDKIKALKEYELFYASTYGYMHWIFIDKNSDTVYHRSQLMTF